jgi:hypothetical protein
MSSPDIITPSTNDALREAAARYSSTVAIPCFLEDVDGFANAYLGKPGGQFSTLVTGDEESLAVSVTGPGNTTEAFVNIDLAVPGGSPASIVQPGLYNKDGEPDPKGEIARPVVRALTETEGRELTMDLHSLVAKIPADRHKS